MTDDHDLLQCTECGEPFGSTTLVFVDKQERPICDHCQEGRVVAVARVRNWYDRPMGGKLVRQEIVDVKRIPRWKVIR
jgi:hypothetical protein